MPKLCRTYSMSSASFYKWWAKYAGMNLSSMKRLKEHAARTPNPTGRPRLIGAIVSELAMPKEDALLSVRRLGDGAGRDAVEC